MRVHKAGLGPIYAHGDLRCGHYKTIDLKVHTRLGRQMTKFVVTGTGRSGSGWISLVLRNAGVLCGHEQVYNPFGVCWKRWVKDEPEWHADSSWLALPHLDKFDGPVFQLVRHPLKGYPVTGPLSHDCGSKCPITHTPSSNASNSPGHIYIYRKQQQGSPLLVGLEQAMRGVFQRAV